MAGGSDLELLGFAEFEKRLKPRAVKRSLAKHVRQAMKLNALIAEDAIRSDFDSGTAYKANAPMTIALKGHSTPLQGKPPSLLKQSIASDVPHWDTMIVGVLRSKKVKGEDGKLDDLLSIAFIVHNGARITVTEKMRNFFAARGTPLKASTKLIVIPARPFLESSVKKSLYDNYRANWQDAVVKVFREMGKKGGS